MEHYESLTLEQKQVIEKHLELVMKANETTNLTRIEGRQNGMILHVEDSLSALEEIEDAPRGLYGDLGSGAGYPGIPLAIATGRKTLLVDTRQKKMKIVDSIIDELNLDQQVSTFAGRAELLAIKKPKSFAVLTARALSSLSVLMELGNPLLIKGGRIICYKAQLEEVELEHALSLQKMLGMKIVGRRSFLLKGEYQRTIVTIEKIGEPTIKLPRREGEAQKNPL